MEDTSTSNWTISWQPLTSRPFWCRFPVGKTRWEKLLNWFGGGPHRWEMVSGEGFHIEIRPIE